MNKYAAERKRFYNKYVTLAIASLFCITAHGQFIRNNTFATQFKRLQADTLLVAPRDTVAGAPTGSFAGIGSTVYLKTSTSWVAVQGGGGSGPTYTQGFGIQIQGLVLKVDTAALPKDTLRYAKSIHFNTVTLAAELENDVQNPGPDKYYGTDSITGLKGWWQNRGLNIGAIQNSTSETITSSRGASVTLQNASGTITGPLSAAKFLEFDAKPTLQRFLDSIAAVRAAVGSGMAGAETDYIFQAQGVKLATVYNNPSFIGSIPFTKLTDTSRVVNKTEVYDNPDWIYRLQIAKIANLQPALDFKSDITHNHTLDGLINMNTTGKAAGDLLQWDGTNWRKFTPDFLSIAGGDARYRPLSTQIPISAIAATGGSTGKVLSWDGLWIPAGGATTISATQNATQVSLYSSTSAFVQGLTNASALVAGPLSAADWTTFNAKQAALVSGTNLKTINGNSLLGSGDITITGGGGGITLQQLADSVALRQRPLGWFDVRDYGAKGNGKQLLDGAMTGSTFTSATAGFTSGDVGKVIHVKGAGASGGDATGTITGFTNSTTVTLSFSAGTPVSAKQFVYGNDDTQAIQAALDAAVGAIGGTVYAPRGIYIINGALKTNVSGENPNAQLAVLPVDYSPSLKPRVVRILGENNSDFFETALALETVTTGGTIFYSTIQGSGTYPSVIGTKGFAANTYYSMVQLELERINIRVLANAPVAGPTMSGVNFEWFAACGAEYVKVGIDIGALNSHSPTATTFGFKTTKSNASAYVNFNNNMVYGMKYGYVMGEHTTGNNNHAYLNETAIAVTHMNHPIYLQRFEASWNKYTLGVFTDEETGAAFVDIAQLDMELRNDGHWYDNTTTINDPNSFIRGSVKHYPLLTSGAAFTKVGANNLTLVDMRSGNLDARQRQGSTGAVTTGQGLVPTGSVIFEQNSGLTSTGLENLPIHVFSTMQTDKTTYGNIGVLQFVNGNSDVTEKRVGQFNMTLDVGANSFAKGKGIWYVNNNANLVEAFSFTSGTFKVSSTNLQWTGGSGTGTKVAAFDASGNLVRTTYDPGAGGGGGSLPDMTGQSGKYLTNNGSSANWATISGASQWTTVNTNDIEYHTGNVGILTSSGTPVAPLHINRTFGTSRGQIALQDPVNSGTSAIVFESYVGANNTRLGLQGYAKYAGSTDPAYYFSNELTNGGFIWTRSSGATIMNLIDASTEVKLGVGITPATTGHFYSTTNTRVTSETSADAGYASNDWKVNGNLVAQMLGTGSSFTGGGIFNASAASFASYLSGGTNVIAGHASGVIRFATGGLDASNERLQITAGGVLNYAADKSGSYTSRSVPDKAYVDAAVASGTYAGETVVRVTTQNYTVPTTLKIYNIIYDYPTGAGTFTLPTGSTADKEVLYISNTTSGTITFSQSVWVNSSTSSTSLEAAGSIKLVYSNTDSKWYAILNN